MFLLQTEAENSWMAPYAYTIVLLGFVFFLFRVFENWYAAQYDRPLFRHYWVYKRISKAQEAVLEEEFYFYSLLSKRYKRQFRHRVATFIADKQFIGRDELVVTDRMKTLIAAVGCMLSFGRKHYEYELIKYVLIYPKEFYSEANQSYHKGEFNPRQRALVFSWQDFESGYRINDDNLNLGIHEFMHAMQLEARKNRDIDATRFTKQFQNILRRLTHQEVKDKLDETRYFRAYAFTNQYEFMAVLAEYFIESPTDFKDHFPQLYDHTQKLLNFRFAGY
ncbi:MAG: zinc-dependent peptidase [Marinirhabdus sp.]|nr:zinc-dependent peptidase [Marinirhabdus sp.]